MALVPLAMAGVFFVPRVDFQRQTGPAAGAVAAPAAAYARTPPAADSVTVSHEYLTVQSKPTRPSPGAVTRARRTLHARTQRPQQTGFVVRAGRMLVGDGRHRPEPFPRPAIR